jgi:hypothetical protein
LWLNSPDLDAFSLFPPTSRHYLSLTGLITPRDGLTANKNPVDTLLFRLVHVFVPVLPDAVSCWWKISKAAEDSKVIPLIAAVPENPP